MTNIFEIVLLLILSFNLLSPLRTIGLIEYFFLFWTKKIILVQLKQNNFHIILVQKSLN